MISLSNKFIFVHIIKNGGTSIDNILKDYAYNFNYNQGPYSDHSTIKEIYNELSLEQYNQFYKFTVIRHPIFRISSLYYFSYSRYIHHNNGMITPRQTPPKFNSLENFVKCLPSLYRNEEKENKLKNFKNMTYSFLPQIDWLKINNKITFDKIIKLKDLNQEWPSLLNDLKIKYKPLTHERKGVKYKEDYISMYTQEMKDIIYDIYEKDMKEFNFQYH